MLTNNTILQRYIAVKNMKSVSWYFFYYSKEIDILEVMKKGQIKKKNYLETNALTNGKMWKEVTRVNGFKD